MKFPHYYDENHLNVPEASWEALKKDPASTGFRDMIATAQKTIREGGAFIVYRESTTEIILRFDRNSDLDIELAEING